MDSAAAARPLAMRSFVLLAVILKHGVCADTARYTVIIRSSYSMTCIRRCFALLLAALMLPACTRETPEGSNEILWDTWGVPHIYAASKPDAFRLLGWAQARAHANSLALAFGKGRGQAAEHWGEAYLHQDLLVINLSLNERSPGWLEQIAPEYRACLDAFVRGINDYVTRYPEAVRPENRWVFPLETLDVVRLGQRSLAEFMYFDHDGEVIAEYSERLEQRAANASGRERTRTRAFGSNGYAIGPKKSVSGHAMLAINPHLPWADDAAFFESHIVSEGIDSYGAAVIGQPFHAIGFTPALGWTHTVNPADAVDTYELILKDDGYLYDGRVMAFERSPDVRLKVRDDSGKVTEHVVERRASVHGPVVLYDKKAGRALAVRFAGLESRLAPERYWSLMAARNRQEFEAITTQFPIPYFNTVYADRDGNILFQYNAAHPNRSGTYAQWRDLVPGDSSQWLWSATAPITQMPALANPSTGFLQNSNDPPWSSTFPPELRPDKYPATLPPPAMDFRTQSITKMLLAAPKLDFAELVRQKNSNRVEMAERFLPELLAASAPSKSPLVQQARKILGAWNYRLDPDARGAVIFLRWVQMMGGTDATWAAEPWNPEDPLATPRGLKSDDTAIATLEAAAKQVVERYGALDVPFGEVYRMRLGGKDFPSRVASVYYGTVADGGFERGDDNRYTIDSGDTFVAIVEYSQPIRAEGLLPQGNSSQPGSPHVGDQLELFSQGKLRKLWRDRAEIEQHLELREQL